MTVWLIWLLVASALIIAEIFTLSFYLLLAGIGALAASALAASGFSDTVQVAVATVVTLIGWFMVHKFRPQKKHPDSRTNPDLNMDIGTNVKISAILPDGKLAVMLRGAKWDARIEDGSAPDITTDYIITKIDGSILILTPKQ